MNKRVKSSQKKEKKRKHQKTLSMTFFLAGFVFLCLSFLVVFVYFLLKKIFKINVRAAIQIDIVNPRLIFFLVVFGCIVLGYGLTLLLSKLIMHPVKKLTQAMEDLSSGTYKTRLAFRMKLPFFEDISFSFNKMANELEHTEMLSNDFINNFSHEFKTPIVSISGFAKLLQKGNLTHEQQVEYLNIIEEESMRLSGLATSILKLMKIENQAILSDVKKFNLSEQIRNCVLLLEDKWAIKDLDILLDFDEYNIDGNEELLKEVWINLFDNAIKYTPNGGKIYFDIKTKDSIIVVSVANEGSEISAEHQRRIFNKFYQVDKSHSSQGNGVGLAIVKKVVELHRGNVFVLSGNNKTVFMVSLPA